MYTLINGIKIPSPDNKNRCVLLDIFPDDLLDRLEVIKALTPNMEGDAIGGVVEYDYERCALSVYYKNRCSIGLYC